MSKSDYTDPFYEEFDEKDVVNRGDFEPNEPQEIDSSQPLVPKADLIDVVSKGGNLTVKNPFIDNDEEEEYHGIIKKSDVDSGKFNVSNLSDYSDNTLTDDEELDSFDYELDDDDNDEDDNDLDLLDDIDTTPEPNINKPKENKPTTNNQNNEGLQFGLNPDDENIEYLQRNFKDFLSLPKITGKFSKSIENNLIPKDIVKKTGKTIEIADDLPQTKDTLKQSSVIINRDEQGEIESMEVICKCGERTLIKFEYLAPQDIDKGLTDIEDDKYEPIPFNELKNETEEVVILNPNLVNIPSEEDGNDETDEDVLDVIEDFDDDWMDDYNHDDDDD